METSKKKNTIQFRYWQASVLMLGGAGLVVGAFYLGLVLGRVQEGQDRISTLKKIKEVEAVREGIPLSFYEELKKDSGSLDQKRVHAPGKVPPGDGAGGVSKPSAEGKDRVSPVGAAPAESDVPTAVGMSLQVASFKEKGKADSVAERLRKQGFPATVRDVDLRDKGVWYRVEVGPFPSTEALDAARERLRHDEGKPPPKMPQ